MITKIENQKIDENLIFYRILKLLIKLKLSESKLLNLQILIDTAIKEKICVLDLLQKDKNYTKMLYALKFSENKISNFDLLFKFSVSLIRVKNYLWNEIKFLTDNKFTKKIINIKDKLSLEYDFLSLNYPYGFRVIFSLIIENLLSKNKEINFLNNIHENKTIKEVKNQLIKIQKNSLLESSTIFNLIINESVNQSIKSSAGMSYEERVKTTLLIVNNNDNSLSNITTHQHDDKINSVEYDILFNYSKFKIGVSIKRTLRERYKQNFENINDLCIDKMMLITLGIDLTKNKVNNILEKKDYFIIVSKELYYQKDYLKENKFVFNSIESCLKYFIN